MMPNTCPRIELTDLRFAIRRKWEMLLQLSQMLITTAGTWGQTGEVNTKPSQPAGAQHPRKYWRSNGNSASSNTHHHPSEHRLPPSAECTFRPFFPVLCPKQSSSKSAFTSLSFHSRHKDASSGIIYIRVSFMIGFLETIWRDQAYRTAIFFITDCLFSLSDLSLPKQ